MGSQGLVVLVIHGNRKYPEDLVVGPLPNLMAGFMVVIRSPLDPHLTGIPSSKSSAAEALELGILVTVLVEGIEMGPPGYF